MIDRSLVPHAETLDGDGRVVVDTRCRACRYQLRTRPADAACPECGTPVASSLPADLLAISDAAWRRRLRRGVCFIIAAWGAAIPLAALWYLVDRAQATGAIGAGGAAVGNVGLWTTHAALLVGAVWLATTREPGRVELAWSAPRVARVGTAGAALVMLASTVTSEVVSIGGSWPQTTGGLLTSTYFLATNVVVMTLRLIGWGSLLWYGVVLARRIPYDRLALATRLVLTVYVVCEGGAIVAMIARMAMNEIVNQGMGVSSLVNAGIQAIDLCTTVAMPIIALAGFGLLIWFALALRTPFTRAGSMD